MVPPVKSPSAVLFLLVFGVCCLGPVRAVYAQGDPLPPGPPVAPEEPEQPAAPEKPEQPEQPEQPAAEGAGEQPVAHPEPAADSELVDADVQEADDATPGVEPQDSAGPAAPPFPVSAWAAPATAPRAGDSQSASAASVSSPSTEAPDAPKPGPADKFDAALGGMPVVQQNIEHVHSSLPYNGGPTAHRRAEVDESAVGVVAIGESAHLRLGGFVLINYAVDWTGPDMSNLFVPSAILVPDEPVPLTTSFTARDTRFNFDFQSEHNIGVVRAFMEADFGGGGRVVRIRHAYGAVGTVRVGYSWSAFMDVDVLPETADVEGSSAALYRRHPVLQWNPSLGRGFDATLALERPVSLIRSVDGATAVQSLERIPDGIAKLRLSGSRGHVLAAGIGRQLVVADGRGGSDTAPGYGATIAAVVRFEEHHHANDVRFQFSAGRGIQSYMTGTLSASFIDGGQDALYDTTTGES